MKMVIIGSRSIKEFDLTRYVPPEIDTIITGGAGGMDKIAEEYADRHKLSKYVIRPRYDRYKKNAPLIRNRQMIDMADYILIVWDGVSRGTKSAIDYIEKEDIRHPTIIVYRSEHAVTSDEA